MNRLLAAAALALLMTGCGTVKNTISDGDDKRLMLTGNDPVSYFTDGKPVRGQPAIKAEHEGVTYRFANEANRAAFLKQPQRYVPQYAGYCTSGMPYALKAAIGAETFVILNDKLYLFGSPRSRRGWLLDWERNIATGDKYWNDEVREAHSRIQNFKRYVFKVPGYRTDEELDAEYARRKAAGTLSEVLKKLPGEGGV
jgi:YHS domain-containing protein